MMSTRLLLVLCSVMEILNSLEVIPERPAITYLDNFYLEWGNLTVKRYGRRSRYYVNLEGKTKHAWGNNITVQLIFYELLSNEYRRSFIEYRTRACDFLRDEPYIGHLLAKSGLKGRTCPFPAENFGCTRNSIMAKEFSIRAAGAARGAARDVLAQVSRRVIRAKVIYGTLSSLVVIFRVKQAPCRSYTKKVYAHVNTCTENDI
ncbi:hypothetical protein EVAR_103125_1 [Eumeta japonica]|uniref:Uncharacterized protein n=1 Tax=Eumeta variegata TaxID=151549 RepID=A0A4C1X5G6_EUMVA|nr:hypothetical protein EVAR_103125_1 [Eumeta japonica]